MKRGGKEIFIGAFFVTTALSHEAQADTSGGKALELIQNVRSKVASMQNSDLPETVSAPACFYPTEESKGTTMICVDESRNLLQIDWSQKGFTLSEPLAERQCTYDTEGNLGDNSSNQDECNAMMDLLGELMTAAPTARFM